jgi:hypothetical protein
LAGYRRILTQQSNALSQSELTKAEGEVERLKIQQDTLKQQIELHERKLALLKRQPQPASRQTRGGTGELSIQTLPTLLYAGKDFHQWLKILREDLDPTSRAEAIGALAAFANHGRGREVAEAIIDVFKDYKLVPFDGTPMGKMREAAWQTFSRIDNGSVSTIPLDDALPVVRQALTSDNANQRFFAVVVVQSLADTDTVVPLLVERLKDADSDVRYQAAAYVLTRAPDSPGLIDVVRQWLSPENNQQQSQTALNVLSLAPREMQLKLAPEVVKLLDREVGLGDRAGQSGNASHVVRNLGLDSIPALEEGAKSENKVVRERSLELLDQLRAKPFEDSPKVLAPAK